MRSESSPDADPFITTPARQPSTPPIFLRDFAYPDSVRVVLMEQMRIAGDRSIARSLAKDFAESIVEKERVMSHYLGTPTRSHWWWMALGGKDADEAKKLRQRLLSGPMMEIFVGKERKQWSLHRNLLCHHSPYFETELLGHEVPKKQDADGSNKLELPDDDPRGFELFVKWLYQGQLDDVSDLDNNAKYEYAVACHKLYLLASKFSMPHLSNLAMDEYRRNLHAAHLVPDADEVNDIYRSSPPGSPFRKLMTKIAARQIMDPEIEKDAESYRAAFEGNPDFAVEMVNAIRYMSGGILFDNPTDGRECEWHDHSDGRDCNGQLVGKGKGKASVPYINGISGPPPQLGRRIQSPTMTRVRSTPLAELPVDKRTPRKLNLPPQQSAAKPGAQQTSISRRRVASTPLRNATGVSPSPTKPGTGQALPKQRPKLSKRAASYTSASANKASLTTPKKSVSADNSPIEVAKRPKREGKENSAKALTHSLVAPNGGEKAKDMNVSTPPRKPAVVNGDGRRAVSGPARVNGELTTRANGMSGGQTSESQPNHSAQQRHESQVNGIARHSNGTSDSGSQDSLKGRRKRAMGKAQDGLGGRRAGMPREAGAGAKNIAETTDTGTSDGSSERKQPVKLKRKLSG